MKKFIYSITIALAIVLYMSPLSSHSQTPSFGAPIVDAADKGDANMVERLIKDGAFVDEAGDFKVTALMRAAFRGNRQIADMLIKAGADVNARDIGGASPMHMAARAGKAEIIKLLMEHKAEVDIKDEEGWTPLMRASNAGKDEVVQALLKSGANPNQKNAWDESSLIYAVKRGNVKVASTLLESGAKPEGKDADGRSIIQLAEISKNSELKELISKPAPAPAPAPAMQVVAKPETISSTVTPAIAPAPTATIATPAENKPEEKPTRKKILREEGEPAPVEVITSTSSAGVSSTSAPPAQPSPPAVLPPAKQEEKPDSQMPAEKNFLIQIGFFQEADKDKAASKMHEVWSEKSKAHPEIFKNLTPVVTGVKLYGQEDLYRIRAGYFTNRQDAEEVCKKLAGIESGCVVIKASAAEEERSLDAEKALMEISEKQPKEKATEAKTEVKTRPETVEVMPAPEKPVIEPKGKIESSLVEKLQTSPSAALPAAKAQLVAPPAVAAPISTTNTTKSTVGKKPKDEISVTKDLNNNQLKGKQIAEPVADEQPFEKPALRKSPETKTVKPAVKPEQEVEATRELNNRQVSGITTPPPAPKAKIVKQSEEEKTKALNNLQLQQKPDEQQQVTPQAAASNTTPQPIKKIEETIPAAQTKYLDQQPVRPANEGEVEVKEAIRVPLSGENSSRPQYFIAPEKPAYSYGDIVVEIFWFDAEAAAKTFAAELKANRHDLIGDAKASAKPHESGKFILVLGAFGTVGESQEVCRIAKSAGLYCTTQKILQGMQQAASPFGANQELGGRSGRFWALLGGYQSGREAVEAFESLTPAIPSEFKSVGHEVKASRAGRSKVYRLKAGHFGSRASAEKFCEAVESRADLCQVVEE